MNKEPLHFSFKSTFFAFKNPSKITLEDQKITAHFLKMKFGILQDGKGEFTIDRDNISSMNFSFISNIIFSIIAIILGGIGFEILDSMRYQEEYGFYAMVSLLLGFFGGIYMYETMIKPKKKLEEITLSIEFLINGVFVIISVITFLFVFFNVGLRAIFSGLFLTSGILLFVSILTLKFQIVDKKGFVYNFPFLFWQYGEIKRIFKANFPEFFVESEKIIKYQEDTEMENSTENSNTYARNIKKSSKGILLGLIIGSIIATAISYLLPLESGLSPITFLKMIDNAFGRSGGEMIVFAFVLPFIILILLGGITFFKNISGGIKIFVNILSGVTLSTLFSLAFFPIHYMNVFIGKMSASDIKKASDDIAFGLWAIFLFIAMICMIIYTIQINSKK